MDKSIFEEQAIGPTEQDLKEKLGTNYGIWAELRDLVVQLHPGAKAEWNFPGTKYGWSFRIKDRKRAIIYLLPRDGFFKVAFVFGQKAMDAIMCSGVSSEIITELEAAPKYAEGRGIRIEVRDASKIADITRLVQIKLAH